MRFLVLLAALSSIAAKPVTVYIGPATKDGFVSTENKVMDSVQEIREAFTKELRKSPGFVLVGMEEKADVKVYVQRSTSFSTSTGYVGGVTTIGSTTFGYVSKPVISWNTLDAEIQVGVHAQHVYASDAGWKNLAKRLSKDIAVWLIANREPIAKHAKMRQDLLSILCELPSNVDKIECGK